MKKKLNWMLVVNSFLILFAILFSQCTNSLNDKNKTVKADYKSLYNNLKQKSAPYNLNSSFNSTKGDSILTIPVVHYPVITIEDITYLSSLSQEQFEEMLENLKYKLEEAGIDFDEMQANKYMEVFDMLGGHSGVDDLISFGNEYLSMEEGWNNIELLLPDESDDNIITLYLGMALYVDNIARPIKDGLVSREYLMTTHTKDHDHPACKIQLEQELAVAGIGLAWDVFLDCMAGGTLTIYDVDFTLIDAYDIWLNYEVCNHRWH